MLLTLGRAWDLIDSLLPVLGPALDHLDVSGDARRFEPLITSIVLTGSSPDPSEAIRSIAGLPVVTRTLEQSPRRLRFVFRDTPIDLHVVPSDEYGSVLFSTTGTAAHTARVLQRRAPSLCPTETALYAQAGLPFIPPEIRDGGDEIQAAAAGRLPSLVTRSDIRGDLHMHTTASDGRDSLDDMVLACRAIGHEYIAITDHSVTSAASRTVTADGLKQQADEIARVRERVPGLTVLHGVEVDILPDGTLDFADAVLEPLDVVVASLHDRAGQDGRRLTERCLQAIRHPLVSIISHPSNQLVGRRPGYDLDYPRIYAAAAETGTALEIDGAPSHLDLDGEHARAAVDAGVTVTIDSDCHRASALERQMTFGVGTARRGWVEPRHVLNARPLDELLAFVQRKRSAC
ncbi:MAG TPA: PHP domain-containing protein [Vicinamibacterales bacterium]|nr:PHP domain-containing protein [Vicinamibacterales bacterium]